MKKMTVIGGGVMGTGIAYTAAMCGFSVSLVEPFPQARAKTAQTIEQYIQKGRKKGKLSEEEAERVKASLHIVASLQESDANCDVVIEAVPEQLDLKKKIFEEIDAYVSEHTLLATNTSTMSPTEIGAFTKRPHQVIAMHFFNPVPSMPLIEIIKGLETSDATVEKAKMVAEMMKKETVVVNEFPGFITSRISALVGNEAFRMLQEGVGTPEEIDKAIKFGLHYPMGPFELGDLVGLDTRLNNLRYLHETLGETYRPAPLLVKYVKAGRLGRKAGKGVYSYDEEGKRL
ncbi:3-hydroxyacyl-CoA dehydrogenase [Bacillus fonticola]|uniref:3-hydroxyacyl-CoA dehydrogenase n=1 Tax=Bacillus fonticola TaxID=2728853 RepID=UPI001475E8B0|nr:3-hydroxyacyl-CoA dehydrogenase [Bacillus fonticola]